MANTNAYIILNYTFGVKSYSWAFVGVEFSGIWDHESHITENFIHGWVFIALQILFDETEIHGSSDHFIVVLKCKNTVCICI